MNKKPAVFFDRDGTLMEEVDFCNSPAQVHVFSGVSKVLSQLRASGWFVFVITNQSGIARRKISLPQYEAVHKEFLRQVEGEVDACYFCPDVEPSPRRKPNIGMVLEATAAFPVDLERSYFVGDKDTDIECGKRAGMRSILVTTGYGKQYRNCGADRVFSDAVAAGYFILKESLETDHSE